jgi:hypothetical protein
MLGILVVAIIDYVSGVELRVGPLYYVPLSLVAWELERRTVVRGRGLCAICVMGANYLAGQTFSSPGVGWFNFTMQCLSFMVIGLLIAALRGALAHERALSRTDTLTSLLNARTFYEEAARVLALTRRTRTPWPWPTWTWTTSRSSTTPAATARGTRSCARSAPSSSAARGRATWPRGLAGRVRAAHAGDGPERARQACERLRTLIAERFRADPPR